MQKSNARHNESSKWTLIFSPFDNRECAWTFCKRKSATKKVLAKVCKFYMKFAFQRSLLRSKISHETICNAFDEKVVTSEAVASVNRQFFSKPSKAAFCFPSCCRCIGPNPVQHLKKMKKLLAREELVDKKSGKKWKRKSAGKTQKKTEKGETCSS